MSKKSFKIDNSLVLRPQSVAPSNPVDGEMYYDSADNKFKKYENGSWSDIGAGEATPVTGGINFFNNPDFETNINDWTSSDAGVALSAETAAPLVGTRSLLVTKDAANRENEFVSGTARDIDLAYRGRPLPFSFEFDTTDANYASDDVRVAVYDNTNAAYLYVAPVSNVSDTLGLLKTSGKALVMVYPESTTVSITPRLIINSTNATSYALKFDAFKIGPDQLTVTGSGVVGEVIALPSTTTPANFLYCNGAAVNISDYPELFEIIGYAHGNPGGGQFNLPNYLGRFLRGQANGSSRDPDRAARTAMATGGNTGDNVGSVQTDQMGEHNHQWYEYLNTSTTAKSYDPSGVEGDITSAVRTNGSHIKAFNTGTETDILFGDRYTSNTTTGGASETRPENAYVRFYIRYSTGGNVLSTTEAAFSTGFVRANLTASVTDLAPNNSAVKVPLNNIFSSKNLTFDTVNNRFVNNHKSGYFIVEYSLNPLSTNISVGARYRPQLHVNGSSSPVSTGTSCPAPAAAAFVMSNCALVRLEKGDYLELFLHSSADHSASNVGVSNSAHLTSMAIHELPDFSTFSVFGQSEELVSASNSVTAWPFTASNLGDLTSLELQPGKYILSGFVTLDNNGALASAPVVHVGISTTSGNNPAGLIEANNLTTIRHPPADNEQTGIPTPQVYVTVTTPTTYYLKGQASVVTNLRYRGYSLKAIKYQ